MNRIRTWVFQDLSHIIPPNNFQLSNSRLHTTPSSRRFWSFFEFSTKEEPCQDSKKYSSSKDIASNPFLPNDYVDVSKIPQATMMSSTVLNPKAQSPYPFELKATPKNTVQVKKSIAKPDDLTSLLDGNPVPRTLKWKLKGYKTLRHEQAGDFAFVPGGKSYDFDILSRSDYGECVSPGESTVTATQCRDYVARNAASDGAKRNYNSSKAVEDTSVQIRDKNPMRLSSKLVEDKENGEGSVLRAERSKSDAKNLENSKVESSNVSLTPKEQELKLNQSQVSKHRSFIPRPVIKPATSSDQKVPSRLQKVPAAMSSKDTKYLPLEKSETLIKCHQSTAQYSSRSRKNVPKPSPPTLRQCSENCLPSAMKRQSPCCEESSQRQETPLACFNPKAADGEGSRSVGSEWSSVESGQGNGPRISLKPEVNRQQEKGLKDVQTDQSSAYFAPRSSKRATSFAKETYAKSVTDRMQAGSYDLDKGHVLARILKISEPGQQGRRASPCAATLARSKFGHRQSGEEGMASGFDHSMSGGSGNGSRKPPSCPPAATSRSSSSKSVKKPGGEDSSRGGARNSSLNISTTTWNSRRRCKDSDEMAEGREVCTKGREKCRGEETRSKCGKEKKQKKPCKRYCCPELQETMLCDSEKHQCPRKKRSQRDCKEEGRRERSRESSRKKDSTCMTDEKEGRSCKGGGCKRKSEGRQICTDPSRRRSECEGAGRSRERENKCERRDQSCKRESQNHRKNRPDNQSCQRERQESSQCDRAGREICTKIRKRESSNRKNNCQRGSSDQLCGKRSASCNGRRSYSQMTTVLRRSTSSGGVRRFSSLPTISFSLLGLKARGCEIKQEFYGTSNKSRCFGKKDSKPAPSCKKSEDRSQKKCKKGPAKCLSKKSSGTSERKACQPTCKKESKERESSCKKGKEEKSEEPSACKKEQKKYESTCGKPKGSSDREGSCKSKCGSASNKSDDYCSGKKEAKGKEKSQEESTKQRAERELKEMQECKRSMKKKNKERKMDTEKKATGLERVISPCKQKKSKKGCETKDTSKCPPKKFACLPVLGVPLNSLLSNESVFAKEKPLNVFPDRSYSSVKMHSSEESGLKKSTRRWNDFWNFTGDDEYSHDELPLPLVIENQEEEAEDNEYSRSNWFLSWFR